MIAGKTTAQTKAENYIINALKTDRLLEANRVLMV